MKKLIRLLLVLALVALLIPNVFAESYNGSCGTGVTWTLDTETGVLNIRGNGDMKDFGAYAAPWYNYRDSITSVVIEPGVTAIGNYAFTKVTNLASISIPEGVTTIGTNAFYNCTKLKEVYLPQSLEAISTDAFSNCTGNPTFNVVEGTYAHEWAEEKGFKVKVVPAPIVLPAGAEDAYRELYPGCEGEDVLAARMKMYELGFFANKPTQTDYTSAMKDYVKKFERAYGLEEDGLLSPHDQAILFYVSADE